MTDLISEAAELQRNLEEQGKDFFFVGGLALQIWGQPRLTTDIDLTVYTNLINEVEQIKWFLTLYESRIADTKDAVEFARTRRVLLLKTPTETGIDLMLGGLSDTSPELKRASYQRFMPEISLKVCSADTLIALKTVAGRLKDFADIESVMIKQTSLDWDYIVEYLKQALEYEDISAKIAKLNEIKHQYYKP